jgi:hypothetical protein
MTLHWRPASLSRDFVVNSVGNRVRPEHPNTTGDQLGAKAGSIWRQVQTAYKMRLPPKTTIRIAQSIQSSGSWG